jgi:hypothetical protein
MRFTIIALSFLASAPVLAQTSLPSGQALSATLQDGVWCNSEDGGKTCAGFDEFHADGRLTSCGKFSFDRRPFTASGNYEVKGRAVCAVITEASANYAVRPGFRFCVEMLEVTRDRQRYRMTVGDKSEVQTLYRRPKAHKKCPMEGV